MVTLTDKEAQARRMVCLPLDVDTVEQARSLTQELGEYVGMFKVGMELGTQLMFAEYGLSSVVNPSNTFLDLKYCDIPNTVKGAAKAAARGGVYMFNVHASGGARMMDAAMQGVDEAVKEYGVARPKIVAVTVLTSFDEANYINTFLPLNPLFNEMDFSRYIDMSKDDEALQQEFRLLLKQSGLTSVISDQVYHLAKLAESAGLDGIVCSAADLFAVKDHMKEGFMYVTPGIQGTSTPAGSDQRRVFSPGNAVQAGSSIEVIGRAITAAPDRKAAAYEILQDIARYL